MASKPVYVLGTGLSHDGSACLLRDGKVCVAIEKERLTRRKHDGGNDRAAVEYCLSAEGISLDDVALVVQNGNFTMFRSGNDWFRGPRPFDSQTRVVTISHHLAHAYSAFARSPFEESAVLVIDGCGSSLDDCIDLPANQSFAEFPEELRHCIFEKDSLYHFANSSLEPIYKDFSCWGHALKEYPLHPQTTKHSIGGVYQAVSQHIFQGIDDSGKLMGLAPYGREGRFDFEIFSLRDGRVFVNYDWMKDFPEPCRSESQLKANFQYYADLAYWFQREIEQALFYVIEDRRKRCSSDNLCYAGGVALNAVANGKLLNSGLYRNVYIQPAAGDNGLALGCAYYGWLAILGNEKATETPSTTYFGKEYSTDRVRDAVSQYSKWLRPIEGDDYLNSTAELLASGKIVGWYRGGSEFGPRALGNRSILADPRIATIRDQINRDVKFREDFRPFAPSVLAEDVSTYFECEWLDPFMLTVVPVRLDVRKLVPSVVHEDGSARIQTVSKEDNPAYYNLIMKFKTLTGIGLLLNTSLNRRGMPIVETPEQAIQFFLTTGLDVLVINELVFEKRNDCAYGRDQHFIGLEELLKDRSTEMQAMGGRLSLTISGSHTWNLDLDEGVFARDGHASPADTAVNMSAQEFEALKRSTKAEIEDSIRAGRIQVSGDVAKSVNLLKMLES